MDEYQFSLTCDVRDYECDMQGIVNNAVYQNYLEHARHSFLRQQGIDFAEWTRQGVHLVLVRIELDYLFPLRSGDRFAVALRLEPVSRLRFGFRQAITRVPDGKPILRALAIGTALNAQGRPYRPPELERLWPASRA